MNRTIKLGEAAKQKFSNPPKSPSTINKIKTTVLDLTSLPSKKFRNSSNFSNNSKTTKKIHIFLNNSAHEVETVGEEGTAQIIRSPIIKRNKSTSLEEIQQHKLKTFKENEESFKEIIQKLSLENASLTQQLHFNRDQIKVYQKTVLELSTKYEKAKTDVIEIEEKLSLDKKKLSEENEKLLSMIKFLETDHIRSSKGQLHEALEAKILSIDQDREEKAEKYSRVLSKYSFYLQEFLNSQE